MKVDKLPIHEQETATYCHSCGEVRTEDELGECLVCGYRICGKDGCSARCLCDDANRLGISLAEAAGPEAILPAPPPLPTSEEIIRNIERILHGYAVHAV